MSDCQILPFSAERKSLAGRKAERLLALNPDLLPLMKTQELRALLRDIPLAYDSFADGADLEPGCPEWIRREEAMEALDDLSDTIWDLLDSREPPQ